MPKAEFVLTTYDWVPTMPRGYVRDLRIRWALEEAQLPYRVESVPFHKRDAEHYACQPFGQVPWLTDGEQTIFESGAILLHLGERSRGVHGMGEHGKEAHAQALLPNDPEHRAVAVSWLFAALNSVEMPAVPWSLYQFAGDDTQTPGREHLDAFLFSRLGHLERVLANRKWLSETFSIADIAMVDVLRLVNRFDALGEYPDCREYVKRATQRPAFAKAHEDQLAHFAAAD